MSTTEASITQIRAEWQRMRQLYSFYAALNERFGLGVAPFPELDGGEEGIPDIELLKNARKWMAGIDAKATAFNLRQLMHSSAPLAEDKLRLLILRHLNQLQKTEPLREKLDFLFVQYFAQVFGASVHPEDVSFRDVAEALAPIVGTVTKQNFAWAYELEKLTAKLHDYSSLKHLIEGDFLDKGRTLKRSIGPEYFQPAAQVAITKFNFALRAGFFRLMHADIQAIIDALHQLRAAGVQSVDVSRADLGKEESLDGIQAVCQEWRKRLRSDYQLGNSFRQLVIIREICEQRLENPASVEKIEVKVEAKKIEVKKEIAPVVQPLAAAKAAAVPKAVAPSAPISAPARIQEVVSSEQKKEIPAKVPPRPPVVPVAKTNGAAAAAPATVEPKKPLENAQKKAATPSPTIGLEECLECIAEQLLAKKVPPPSSVMLGQTKLPLAKWEIAAFVRGGDDAADALQRAVAARSLLIVALELFKKGQISDLRGALGIASAEATRLEQEMLQAKRKKKMEAAVNLAASGKQLGTLIAQAQQLMK